MTISNQIKRGNCMNPKIEWKEFKGKKYLYLFFDGHFSGDHAQQAINQINLLTRNQADKMDMIWECTKMGGYEPSAREQWQEFIKGLKPNLATIHLITDNFVIRSGAMVVGIFAGLRIQSWATIDEFQAEL